LTLVLRVLVIIVVAVYATPISITTTTVSSEGGTYFNVTGNLIAMDKGISKAAAGVNVTGSCPTGNVTFSSTATSANNQITAGDLVYDVQVNTTATTPALTCFTVNLVIAPNGASQQNYSVTIASDSSPSAGWTIDCKFDIGSILPGSPYSFRTTVS